MHIYQIVLSGSMLITEINGSCLWSNIFRNQKTDNSTIYKEKLLQYICRRLGIKTLIKSYKVLFVFSIYSEILARTFQGFVQGDFYIYAACFIIVFKEKKKINTFVFIFLQNSNVMVDFETIRFNLRKVYLETGKYSEDSNFPANNYSLGHNRLVQCQWERPHEILTNPQFIVNGISRFDVKQGELKNC